MSHGVDVAESSPQTLKDGGNCKVSSLGEQTQYASRKGKRLKNLEEALGRKFREEMAESLDNSIDLKTRIAAVEEAWKFVTSIDATSDNLQERNELFFQFASIVASCLHLNTWIAPTSAVIQ